MSLSRGQRTMTPTICVSAIGTLFLLSLVCCQPAIDTSVQDLSNRNADFGARLYRAVAKRTDDNVFLSLFTLSVAMSALLSATNGPTRDQLLQGLSLTGLDPQTLPDVSHSLKAVVTQGSGAVNLKQGLAVFPDQSIQVSPAYSELVNSKYGGSVRTATYTVPAEAADAINAWAQDQIGDSGQNMVSNLDPQTQVLLATTASYQTRFNPAFNTSSTRDERFYVDKYHVVVVPMMFRADKYFLAYDRSLKAGVLKLPMTDGAAMLIVFPDENVDIVSIEEEVSADKIKAWIAQLKKTKLEVQLPRFLLERAYSLSDVLKTLDIIQVFHEGADLSNMGGAAGPKLTQVFHKALFTADESSSGDVPGGDVTFSTPPPRLTINRPFLFVVYQQTSSSVLLMGRVVDPTKK